VSKGPDFSIHQSLTGDSLTRPDLNHALLQLNHTTHHSASKGKGKGQVLGIALLTYEAQKCLAILEVTAYCQDLMIPQHIMQPSTVRNSEQLDPRCSQQTYQTKSATQGLTL